MDSEYIAAMMDAMEGICLNGRDLRMEVDIQQAFGVYSPVNRLKAAMLFTMAYIVRDEMAIEARNRRLAGDEYVAQCLKLLVGDFEELIIPDLKDMAGLQ